jgi:hypothetical protein
MTLRTTSSKIIFVSFIAITLMASLSITTGLGTAAGFTQCSDGINNDPLQDDLIDSKDPGCHTDFNASNSSTYDPTLNSEINPSSPSGGGGGCSFGCGNPNPPSNSAPTCRDVNVTVTEGSTVNFNLNSYTSDPDGDTLSYNYSNTPNGSLVTNSGSFSWNTGSNDSGNYSMSYTASDGQKSCSRTISLTVNNGHNPNPPVNDLRVSCRVSDTRIEEGDRVTYEVRINGGRAPYDIEWEGDDNDVDGEDDDEFSVRYDREGRYEAEVEVRDANGNRDSDRCSDVVVENDNNFNPPFRGNSAPVITSFALTSTNSNTTYIYDVNAFDPDGDNIFYSLISGPAGLTINPSNGLIQWLPTSAQGNISHPVSVRAGDGYNSAVQSFSIFVQRPVVISQPPVFQPPVVVPQPVANLEIISLRVDNDVQNNAIVSFETNIPANGSVAYSLVSHVRDSNANNYESRANGFSQTTFHQVNLGQLEINRTYYLRALANTSNDSDITSELAFIQLPTGITLGTNTEIVVDDRVATMGLASAFAILFGWLFSPWLLLLIIIILLILILLRGRDKTVISHGSGPTRIQS